MAFMTSLISSGADAFNNLFDVTIDGIDTIRCMGFTPPEGELKTYNVSYMGVSIPKFGAKIDLKREFTIEFREAENYGVLQTLTTWKNSIAIPTGDGDILYGGLAGAGRTAAEKTVTVKAYKSGTSDSLAAIAPATPGLTWTFNRVLCIGTGKPAYTRSGGDKPLTIEAKFIFATYTLS